MLQLCLSCKSNDMKQILTKSGLDLEILEVDEIQVSYKSEVLFFSKDIFKRIYITLFKEKLHLNTKFSYALAQCLVVFPSV